MKKTYVDTVCIVAQVRGVYIHIRYPLRVGYLYATIISKFF